jgi:hypothetical protein
LRYQGDRQANIHQPAPLNPCRVPPPLRYIQSRANDPVDGDEIGNEAPPSLLQAKPLDT